MISGLTTASSIWVVSALGIMIGADYLAESFICMLFIYVYFFMSRILPKPKSDRNTFSVFIVLENFLAIKQIDTLLEKQNITLKSKSVNKGEMYKLDISYFASKTVHQYFLDSVISLKGVIEVSSS
jgi:uncharacterized membrane protein YhiD involved in acid resistance